MNKASVALKELAKTIGWKLVTDDKGFSLYEFEVHVSKYENDSYIVRILDEPNELEIVEMFYTVTKVLPHKLKVKVRKLINKFKIEDFANMCEIASFTVEEYKKHTDFYKLKEYGLILGVDIEELGYNFEYKLKKHKRSAILSVIEVNLPSELAPILGKIKKLDYKIAYVKNNKNMKVEND